MKRRRLLHSLALGSVLGVTGLSGCQTDDPESDTREVVVSNERDDSIQLGVRVEDDDGVVLFSHVYKLQAGTTDQSTADGQIDTQPASVLAFTPDSDVKTWDYIPDTDLNCETQDIGIRIQPNQTIQFYNSC